ncbi:hypothetical protein V8C37DRAFT_26077 [Trichoderma ceciliae]
MGCLAASFGFCWAQLFLLGTCTKYSVAPTCKHVTHVSTSQAFVHDASVTVHFSSYGVHVGGSPRFNCRAPFRVHDLRRGKLYMARLGGDDFACRTGAQMFVFVAEAVWSINAHMGMGRPTGNTLNFCFSPARPYWRSVRSKASTSSRSFPFSTTRAQSLGKKKLYVHVLVVSGRPISRSACRRIPRQPKKVFWRWWWWWW